MAASRRRRTPLPSLLLFAAAAAAAAVEGFYIKGKGKMMTMMNSGGTYRVQRFPTLFFFLL